MRLLPARRCRGGGNSQKGFRVFPGTSRVAEEARGEIPVFAGSGIDARGAGRAFDTTAKRDTVLPAHASDERRGEGSVDFAS